jgi:hypothetical protein
MQDTTIVADGVNQMASTFWPAFWGAFLGIATHMVTHFITVLIEKVERSYDAVCELEIYMNSMLSYIGESKGLLKQIREKIGGLQYSDYLSINFKAPEFPQSTDGIKYLARLDIKNSWILIRHRMGKADQDLRTVIEVMSSKVGFYNSNKERIIGSQIPMQALFAQEMALLKFLDEYVANRLEEIVAVLGECRFLIKNKSWWIRLKLKLNFAAKKKPSQADLTNMKLGIWAEISDMTNLSEEEIKGIFDKLKGTS